MSVQRGDVVLLQAPFTSRAGTKTRPMLVVQNDRNNARMANTILLRTIGHLPDGLMQRVDAALKESLALS